MTGTIKRTTTNFALSIPYFNSPNWGQSFERNMDIIDAVLSTAGVVNNIVGPWTNNTVYGVDDRVVDTTDNTVWQCAVAHTSAVSGTFAADRAANPTYWDAVTQNVVVRGAFVHGADYFVGDFVYDESEVLGGIVITPFTGDTNLRNDIANIGVIFDLKADIAQWPTSTTALGYLRRNAGNTAYETRTPAQTRGDLALDFYESDLSLTALQKGQARANIGADLLGGFRNKIINGDFDIWQRATSQTAASYGSDDRWFNYHAGSTKTHSRQAFTIGQTDVPGNPTYFSRTVVSSVAGASNEVRKIHRIEGVKTLAGKTATLTFYAKADASKNIGVSLDQVFGTGGSPSANVNGNGTLVALTTAWQKHTIVLSIPSITGKTLGSNNDDSLSFNFWFDAGSSLDARSGSLGQQSGTFDIAHVSLVEGDATLEDDPFSPRHIQQELALCQRYYEKSYNINVAPGTAASTAGVHVISRSTTTSEDYWPVRFKISKRTTPTVVVYSPTTGTSGKVRDNSGSADLNAGAYDIGTEGLYVGATFPSSGNVGTFHWAADAEL